MEEQQKEIVFTYRQTEQIEPVQLRYERDLPPCMLRREEPVFDSAEEEDYLAPWRSAIAPPEKVRRENRWGVRLFVGLSLLIGLVCLGVGIWYVGQYGWALPGDQYAQDGGEPPDGDEYYWDRGEISAEATTITRYPVGGLAWLELSPAEGRAPLEPGEVYEKVHLSVVTVLGARHKYSSVGTGVIFSEDGYILTNYHVIAGCSSCSAMVKGPTGAESEYDAHLVGYDAEQDLAVLKVKASGLTPAEFGVSDELSIGDPCYAIGNPLGVHLRSTFTNGIISAASRTVEVDGVNMMLIQTNTALNSGNSGGPLINEYGQVVGINTIKMMSEYDTIEGLGFAIPTSQAERWVNELVMYGELEPQTALGVSVLTVDRRFPDGFHGLLLVEDVDEGGSADLAGLRRGDYIVSFNGQEVSTVDEIFVIRRWLSVGDQVPICVYRNGQYLDLLMTMQAGK